MPISLSLRRSANAASAKPNTAGSLQVPTESRATVSDSAERVSRQLAMDTRPIRRAHAKSDRAA
jgi:hypothetical protein